jgi:hypothetical protein
MKPNQSETTNGRWEGKSQIRGRRAASRERERDAVVSVRPKPNRRAESHATQNPPTRNAKPAEKGAKEGAARNAKGCRRVEPEEFLVHNATASTSSACCRCPPGLLGCSCSAPPRRRSQRSPTNKNAKISGKGGDHQAKKEKGGRK